MKSDIWKIVIIDDSPEDRAEIRRLLLNGSNRRYEFIEAKNGAAGVREALAFKPNCVVLDYFLPDMSAAEVLAALADSHKGTMCPIVVVTGSDSPEVGRAMVRAGAQDFLGKGWMGAQSLTRAIENAAERWTMAHELRASQERLALGMEVAELALAEVDYSTGLNHLCVRAARLFGLGESAMTVARATVHATVHPDDREEVAHRIAQSLDPAGPGWFAMDHRIVRPGGEVRWLSVRKKVFFSGEGAERRPQRAVLAALDVTAEKNAAEAVRLSEERMRMATEATGVGTWQWNLPTDLVRWDAQSFRLYGIAPTPDSCVQYSQWRGAVLAEDLAENERILQDTVRRCGQSRREFRICRRNDGEVRVIESVETARTNEQGQVEWLLGTNLDITERKAAEQVLARHRENLQRAVEQRTAELAASTVALHTAERLAALGTLAAGLGHDIANLTMPIRARLQMLESACITDDTRENFAAISKSLDHLSNLSAGMRLMAMDPERGEASTSATDLHAWCAETSPVLRAALPRHLAFECLTPRGLGVNIPRHRLAQAVFNLVQNAGEAMAAQHSGTVRITAEAATNAAGAPVVRLLVSDDGPGMPAEVVARCFEPYFSTKGRAIATGMGLGMVRGIVESAGGSVAVSSGLGEGTTFTLTLPRAVSGQLIGAGPSRTAAVSIEGQRESSLAMMFLGQLAFKTCRHLGSSAPDVSLWVVERPDPSRVKAYLDQHPLGWLVVLDGGLHSMPSGEGGYGVSDGVGPFSRNARMTVLSPSPSPGDLRAAITDASKAIAPTAAEQ